MYMIPMDVRTHINTIMMQSGLSSKLFYEWVKNELIVFNSKDADTIMDTLHELLNLQSRPMRYNAKTSIIEFGLFKGYFHQKFGKDEDYMHYCVEFETFGIDKLGKPQRGLFIVRKRGQASV
jgi:hypothetical protein